MWIRNDLDFDDLRDQCWSGARERLDHASRLGIEDEFMDYLLAYFGEDERYTPTMTEVNDYIWFNGDDVIESICESKGMDTEGNPIEDEEDEDEEEEDE